jgi:ArsR family transcriptional regulator
MKIIKSYEKIFKALGDKTRLRIINMLMQNSMCVCEITSILPFSQSTVSGHLKVLRDAEILNDNKDGLWVVYSLNKENNFVSKILDDLKSSFVLDENLIKENEKSKNANRDLLCKR